MSLAKTWFAIPALTTLLGATVLTIAPTASAEVLTLDNGLIVDTTTEGAGGGRRIIVTIPEDKFVDVSHLNVRSTGHEQFEREVVNQVSSFIVNRDQTEVSLQACSRWALLGSECGRWSAFNPYPPPPPPPINWVPVMYDSHVFADNAETGTIIGFLEGYKSPGRNGTVHVPFYGCESTRYCQIGFGPGDGRGWIYEGALELP